MTALHVVFGAGPAGLATIDALVRRGLSIRVVTRSSAPVLPEGVEHVTGDAADPAFTVEVCRGAATVYQILNAPYDQWDALFPPLQRGVLAGAEAAGARLVSLENLYAYGRVDGPMTETCAMAPVSTKGEVRAAMTRELLDAHAAGDVEIAIGRASDFFGPHVLLSGIGERVLGRLVTGKPAHVLGDPDRLHTYTYIDDLGEALAILGTRPEAVGRAWHIPSAPAGSTRALVESLASALGVAPRVAAAPKPALWLASWFDPIAGAVLEMTYQFEHDFVMDDAAFRETFGMTHTPLPDAVAKTAAWYRTHITTTQAA